MKRLLKFLHEVSTVGIMGALVAQLILSAYARGLAAHDQAVVRAGILLLSEWLLLPSLAVVLVSGVFAIAIHRPFHNAGWAWVKALLGVAMLEGTLGGVQGTAREAAAITKKIAEGHAEPGLLEPVLRHEAGGLWVVLALSVINIALAIWRPKLSIKIR
jgi:hypothetical protein